MKTTKVIIDFKKQNDSTFYSFCSNVLQEMSANPSFPDPQPSLETVTNLLLNFNEKMLLAIDGGKLAVAQRNQSRKNLEEAMRDLGLYVELKAKGDKLIIVSSGFEHSKDPEKKVIPAPPVNIKVKDGPLSGSAIANAQRDSNADRVIWRYAQVNGSLHEWITTRELTAAKANFSGLQRGATYIFQARCCNTAGISDWSEEVQWMVR